MQAVVLIGGQGTRLRPITYTVPKALVPLRNRPYIGHLVDSLSAAGIDGAVFSMGYLPDPIQRYFAGEELEDFSLEYVVEHEPLGTAGGIKNAEGLLGRGPFVATNRDVLTGLALEEVIEAHIGSGALATITLTRVLLYLATGDFVERNSYDQAGTTHFRGREALGCFEQYTHELPSTVKIITVAPSGTLSRQYHHKRDELWVVLDPGARAEIDGEELYPKVKEKLFISRETVHRLSSVGEGEVRILEISLGEFD